jgi:hypothetical protein
MQKTFILNLLVVFYVKFAIINCLSKYCSTVNKEEIIGKFSDCIKTKNAGGDSFIRANSIEIKNILENVVTSVNDPQTTKSDSRELFLKLLEVLQLAKTHSSLEYCITSLCNLFKNCEFPINIYYKNFENNALVASRVAALLTALTFNEKLDEKTYLTKTNLFSILRSSVIDNDDIYDSKIIFLRTPNQDRFMFHALKDSNIKCNQL